MTVPFNHTGTKGIGETCGGPYGSKGRCKQGLNCTAKEQKFIAGVDITGICLGESQHFILAWQKCTETYMYELVAKEAGQGHVHKVSNCGVGQRKPTNRSIMMNRSCSQPEKTSCTEGSEQSWKCMQVQECN